MTERLDKLIASQGKLSRSDVKKMVKSGFVESGRWICKIHARYVRFCDSGGVSDFEKNCRLFARADTRDDLCYG